MIAGGGTGGHLYPAIAVAKGILERNPSNRILIVGATREASHPIIAKEGLPFRRLRVIGLDRFFSIRTFRFMWSLGVGFIQSLLYILKFRPHVVMGVGGYSSFPPVFLASIMGISTLIHEQNSTPGLANRILGRWVKRICLSFPDGWAKGEKTILTGNPTRKEIGTMDRDASISRFGLEAGRMTILVFGGSRGARSINLVLLEAIGGLEGIEDRIQLIYATGKEDYGWVSSRARRIKIPIYLTNFIFDMPFAYGAADLVIARAGAGTIAEITRCGLPSILIPYPYATAQHQLRNARLLEEKGAAIVIQDHELNADLLAQRIEDLVTHPQRLRQMGQKARELSHPDATSKIVDLIYELGVKR